MKEEKGSGKSRFHDYAHALDYDRRAAESDIRMRLAGRLVEALELSGGEAVLDLATGTGRFARPVAQALSAGKIFGLDQALAMLRVAHEQQQEPIPRFLRVAGLAQSLPFRDRSFALVFVAFALHHFGDPSLAVVREVDRVLGPGGRFFVLDPVLYPRRDELDRSLHEWIHTVFRRSHGEHFRFHSAEEIRALLEQGGFLIKRADIHSFRIDQLGTDGIPMGLHWLEVAEGLEHETEALRRRFEENYFAWCREGDEVRIKGSLSYGLICAEKRL